MRISSNQNYAGSIACKLPGPCNTWLEDVHNRMFASLQLSLQSTSTDGLGVKTIAMCNLQVIVKMYNLYCITSKAQLSIRNLYIDEWNAKSRHVFWTVQSDISIFGSKYSFVRHYLKMYHFSHWLFLLFRFFIVTLHKWVVVVCKNVYCIWLCHWNWRFFSCSLLPFYHQMNLKN